MFKRRYMQRIVFLVSGDSVGSSVGVSRRLHDCVYNIAADRHSREFPRPELRTREETPRNSPIFVYVI